MNSDISSLSHSKWNCKYHIVFAPKYRRQEIYGELKADIVQILRKLCDAKKVEMLEANTCPDHIHMLVKILAEYKHSTIHGIFERKEHTDDLCPTRKFEV